MPSSSRNVIAKEVSANRVVAFEPRKFPTVMPEVAKAFVRLDAGPTTTFKVSDLVAQQTGVSAEEKKILEAKVQEMVVAQLKQVEERAYQEAYELGLDVGRKQSFDHAPRAIRQPINVTRATASTTGRNQRANRSAVRSSDALRDVA